MTNIKVFSDYACPFCYIGFSIIDKLKKNNPDVIIEWMPFELSPDRPFEGTDITKNIPEEQLDMAYKRILRLGSEYDLVYNNKTKSFNTHRLHKASLYANSVDKFYEFSKEAFKTIFEYGKNVADHSIIDEIAVSVGLNVDEMNKQIDEGKFDETMKKAKELVPVHKIDSVPSFIINDDKKVTTLKDYKRITKDILGD